MMSYFLFGKGNAMELGCRINRTSLLRLGNYLYNDNPQMGLSRKLSKWEQIREMMIDRFMTSVFH
jgi:hypothetical protein